MIFRNLAYMAYHLVSRRVCLPLRVRSRSTRGSFQDVVGIFGNANEGESIEQILTEEREARGYPSSRARSAGVVTGRRQAKRSQT